MSPVIVRKFGAFLTCSVVLLLIVGARGNLPEVEWNKPTAFIMDDDSEEVNYPSVTVADSLIHWSSPGTVPSSGRKYTVHVGTLLSGLPQSFSFQLPPQGCCHVNKTSVTAAHYGCEYATNAGFFINHGTPQGCCVGNLVVNSSIVQLSNMYRANIGLNNSSYVIGYLSNQSIQNDKFYTLISGAGWLVRDGMSYIQLSKDREGLADKFVTEKAPRTAAVVHRNGSFSLVQVDGEEDIAAGLDLMEFSEILVRLGAWQAVNLDGGGSSVSVYNGQVISKPTCIDIAVICERQVSAIACMKTIK